MARATDEEIVLNFKQTGADETIKKVNDLTKTIVKFNTAYNNTKSDRAKPLSTDFNKVQAQIIRKINSLGTKGKITKYTSDIRARSAQLFSIPFQSARAEAKGISLDQQFTDQETKLKWQEEHIHEIADQEKRRIAYNEQLAKLTGQQESGISKLGKTLKRVGFYRLARLFYSTLEKGLSQGVNDYAQFDKGMGNTMSQLTSSLRLITSSVGMLVGSLLQIIAPITQTIGQSVAKISNGIAAITAKQKGQTEYTRINLEYWEEYNKEVNKSLLSFDKFETLSGNQDSGPFQTAKIEDANEDIQGIGSALSDLTPILTVISSIAVVKWVLNDGPSKLLSTFSKIGNLFTNFNVAKLTTISTVLLSISGIILGMQSIVTGIIDLVTNWNDMSWGERIAKILKVIMGAAAVLFGTIAIFTKNIKLGIAAATLGIAAAAVPTRFAEGGIPDKGSLFYAGESGAELVHSMPSGNTGVTNIAQFKQAMKEALYESADIFTSGDGTVVLNLDGAQIARSRSFKAELNRTNSGLNLV